MVKIRVWTRTETRQLKHVLNAINCRSHLGECHWSRVVMSAQLVEAVSVESRAFKSTANLLVISP